MSHPDFKNRGSALGRFIEECGEALAAAGKTVRYGWDSFNPLLPVDQQECNEDWLQREVADLEEAIARLKKSRHWTGDCPKPLYAETVSSGVNQSTGGDNV
jgi:hypothetical protein